MFEVGIWNYLSREKQTYDTIFSIIYYCSGVPAVLFNLLLIYMIVKQSPPSLREYRILLMNVAITDLIYAISTTFISVRLIPNKWAFAYIALGPCKYFGSQVCYYTYCVQLHAIFYTFLSFPLSFGFRYWVLVRPMPPVKNIVLLILGLWAIALAQHILFVFSEDDPADIRAYLAQNKPSYNLTGYVISGNNMATKWITAITLISIVVPMFPIYMIVVFFRHRVLMFLKENAHAALTIQASLPVLFIFPPITIYVVYHLELINFTIIEYCVFSMFSFFPLCSPLVSLYFVRPYNLACRRLLRMQRPPVGGASQPHGDLPRVKNTINEIASITVHTSAPDPDKPSMSHHDYGGGAPKVQKVSDMTQPPSNQSY